MRAVFIFASIACSSIALAQPNLIVIGGPIRMTAIGPATQYLQIATPGQSVPFTVTATEDPPTPNPDSPGACSGTWLGLTANRGVTTGTLSTVQVGIQYIPTAGGDFLDFTCTGTVTIAADGAIGPPVTVPVSIFVPDDPASPPWTSASALGFLAVAGGTAPPTQTLLVQPFFGNGIGSATISSVPAGWLSIVVENSSSTQTSVTVTANTSGLSSGTYTGSIVVTAFSSVTIPVSLTIFSSPSNACSMTILPPLSFGPEGTSTAGFLPNTPATVTVTPTAACAGLPWTAASSDPSWLTISSPSSSTMTGASFTLLVSALSNSHPNAVRTGTISIAGGATPAVSYVTETPGCGSLPMCQVRALYESVLGRDPDSAGFQFWTGVGSSGLGQMVDDFLTSSEGVNTDFQVMAVYKAFLGTPSFNAYTTAVTNLRSGGATGVAQLITALLGSDSPSTAAIQTMYMGLLARQPTAVELAQAMAHPLDTTFASIYGGNEFRNIGTSQFLPDHSNAMYIWMLYFVILGRDPDPAGFSFWLGVVNGGGPGVFFNGATSAPTRLNILGPGTPGVGFVGSPEFQSRFQ